MARLLLPFLFSDPDISLNILFTALRRVLPSMYGNLLKSGSMEVYRFMLKMVPQMDGDEFACTMPRIWAETRTAKIDLVENRYRGAGSVLSRALFKIVSSFITRSPY